MVIECKENISIIELRHNLYRYKDKKNKLKRKIEKLFREEKYYRN